MVRAAHTIENKEVLHGLVLHAIDRRRYCVARAAHTIENELLHGQSITNHRHVEVLHGQSANYPR